jgi:protein phosphatase
MPGRYAEASTKGSSSMTIVEGPLVTESSQVQVDLGGLSHRGKVRANNEDHFLAVRFERSMQTIVTNLTDGSIPERSTETAYGMVVADGMGGAAGGEVASRTAIHALVDLFLRTPSWIMRLDEQQIEKFERRMEQRFQKITESLAELAEGNPQLFGMGTTMTFAATLGDDILIAHVGDSRAYLFRDGRLNRLTRDHTVAQALVADGLIDASQAAQHHLRHALTNVLGGQGARVEVDFNELRLHNGDAILLATDGLTDMVSDAAISEVLARPGSADAACRTLVDLALDAGGKDNVTVIVSRYQLPETA